MNERKKVRKVFLVWDFEKEERWLNEMALSGWLLDKVGFCSYEFVRCTPGEYTIRLEMNGYDEGYIGFMEETGAQYIGRMIQWLYFRKKTADGEFDIFSDLDSKISHLNKIGKVLWYIGLANLLIGIVNTFGAVNVGWVNLLCATGLMYGLGRIHGKKEVLKEKRLLME